MAAFGSAGSRQLLVPTLTLILLLCGDSASAHELFRASFRGYAPLPPGTRAIALGDFDRDGALDLAVGNDQLNSVAILLNTGQGEFRPPAFLTTLDYSAAIVTSDLDRDGVLDLVIGGRYSGIVSVFLGRGDGSFGPRADYPTGPAPRSIAIGDVDGDGRFDLVVASEGRFVSVLSGNGDGTFRPRIDSAMDGVSPRTVALADFDHDGRLDLVAGYEGGATFVYVMRGLGDGRFGPIEGYDSSYGPITVASGDLNEDGHQDFVAGGQYDGAVSIHLGHGDGTFATKLRILVPGAIFTTLADIDRDGHLDVLTAAAVMRGHGNGGFDSPVSFLADFDPAQAVAGDLDGDGRLDLVTSHPYPGSVSVLTGRGDGTFDQPAPVAVARYPGGLAAGDVDHDGHVDLAVTSNQDRAVTILMGDGEGGYSNRTDVSDTPSAAVQLTDLNQDGSLDLVVVNFSTVSTRLGTGTGAFGPRRDFTVGPGARTLAIGDFNEDGRPDIVTPNTGSLSPDPRGGFLPDSSASVLLGAGDGTFASPLDLRTAELPYAVSVADVNRDGHGDVIVTNLRSSSVSVLLGNGDGTFRPRIDNATGGTPVGLVIGDFDGDGVLDVATANSSGRSVSVLRGNGEGSFEPQDEIIGFGLLQWIGAGDWDGDGILDLAVTQDNANTVRLVMGHGDGSFSSGDLYGAGSGPQQGVVTDLDADGHPDIVVANYYGASVSPLLNLAADPVTATALALLDIETEPGRVRLRWHGSGSADEYFAERRSMNESWIVIGAPQQDRGLLVFEDVTVLPGKRYAFRLRSGVARSAETWVDIPLSAQLVLSPNFRSRTGTVSLTLASRQPARLDVYDAGGRRLVRRNLERLGPGDHELALPEASSWKSGIYFARLVQGIQSAQAKWSIVR